MLGLKLNHVSNKGPRWIKNALFDYEAYTKWLIFYRLYIFFKFIFVKGIVLHIIPASWAIRSTCPTQLMILLVMTRRRHDQEHQQPYYWPSSPRLLHQHHPENWRWPSVATWRHWSGSVLSQVMACCLTTWSIHEPVSTYHLWCFVAFIYDQCHRKCSKYQLIKWV